MMVKHLSIIVLALALVIPALQAGASDKLPSGTLTIEEEQMSLIIGGSFGHGLLKYEGGEYPFKASGLKVGSVGVSKISAVGAVYDLYDLSKFPGTYVAGDYGITLGGGVGGMVMKNEHNVYINIKSTSEGIALQLGSSGLTIKLEE